MDHSKPFRKLRARDIMNDNVVTISSELRVNYAANLLRQNRITGGPVINPEGEVVGVFSVSDLLFPLATAGKVSEASDAFFNRAKLQQLDQLDAAGHLETLEDHKVKDLMTTDLISRSSSTPISQLASLMLEKKVHRVLIIDNNRLAGIVTATDVLKAVARCGS